MDRALSMLHFFIKQLNCSNYINEFHICNIFSSCRYAIIVSIQKQVVTIIIYFTMSCDILYLLASNLTTNRRIATMKVLCSNDEKRMDRFDAIIHEWLRANRKTTGYLAEKVGCDQSSLWRYRRKIEYFKRAPLEIIANCLRTVNVSNQDLRYILGLPTGQHDGE